jgi:hypothetical protein
MKKLIGLATAGLLAASLLGAPASAGKATVQHVEGTVALPAFFAQSAQGGTPFDGCWGGATRRTTTPTGEETSPANGALGYRFKVDKATWNKPFKLEATGGEGTVDFDLFLYSYIPTPEESADDPVNGGTPISVDFQTREEGGEKGIVPPNTTTAIVCLYGGDAYYGYNASFMYMAGKGVK